jgi:hypothetical protein
MAQQNEVTLITSRKETIPENLNFQVMRPFRRWNAIEAIRLFPRLLSRMPDVLHFVFSEAHQKPTVAEWLLCQFIQPIPGKVAAVSFFHAPQDFDSIWLRAFLKSCHLITWASRSHLLASKRTHHLSRNPIIEVLPPFFDIPEMREASHEESHEEVAKLTSTLQDYFLIPSDPEDFFNAVKKDDLFFDEKINYLFLSVRPPLKNTFLQKHDLTFFYLPSTNSQDIELAIRKAKALLLAFSDLSVLELQRFFQLSLKTKTPLIIRPRQNDLFPGLVIPGRTGWVLEDGETSLRELFLNNPKLDLNLSPDQNTNRNLSHDMIDSSVNELHRFYKRALAARS